MTILELPAYNFNRHDKANGVVGIPVELMLGYKPYYSGTVFHIREGVKLYTSLDTNEVSARLKNIHIYGFGLNV